MIVIKKRSVVIISVLLATIITAIICFGALNREASKSSLTNDIIVVIDAGHGGIDGGAVGVNTKVKESELNLIYSKKIGKLLTDAGIRVVYTRNSDAGLYGVATKNFKKKEMQKRNEIINSSNASAVVSVHMNKYTLSSRRGAQVFYKESSDGGKVLAESVQSELNAMEECVKQTSILTGDYYIIKCSKIPSIILECGFLSNEEDEKLLIESDYQDKFCYTVFRGIVKYFSKVSIIIDKNKN